MMQMMKIPGSPSWQNILFSDFSKLLEFRKTAEMQEYNSIELNKAHASAIKEHRNL